MEDGGIGDFAQLLIDTNVIHEIISPTDYRTKAPWGKPAYYSATNGGTALFRSSLKQALGKTTFIYKKQVRIHTIVYSSPQS